MAKVRSEVRILRGFSSPRRRVMALDRLLRRYVRGRRCASDVLMALDALGAQNRWDECGVTLTWALCAVQPVPRVLFRWGCANVERLGPEAMRCLLRCAAYDGVCRRELAGRLAVTKTPAVVVALLEEKELPHVGAWARELVLPTVAAMLA